MDINRFLTYLREEKNASDNTVTAYGRDIRSFEKYMSERASSPECATKTDVVTYLMELGKSGRSKATTNRRLASLRAYYGFMIAEGVVKQDPTAGIRTPRAERRELDYLTIEETEKLLSMPDDSIKGKRDRAILEVLYGTGIRVMELIELNIGELNMRMGFVTCSGNHGKPRIVPIGSYAKRALEDYIAESRPALMSGRDHQNDDESPLFINYTGERFTRQGLWKVLKAYGRGADMEERITPHILRTSFAVHMVQNGADIKALQELLGYDDVQAMQVFMQVSGSRIKDVYDKTHPRA